MSTDVQFSDVDPASVRMQELVEPVEPVEPAEPAEPAAMVAGTFAIYDDGRGGYVLVTDTTTGGVERRHIPAALVKLMTGGGIISRKFAAVFGGTP